MNVTETFRGFSAPRSLPRGGERTELHALTLPLDVERTKTVRPGPSGSVSHTELHAQGRVAVPPTLPLDVERTETVRSGPSGSAIHMELHAQARVAVPLTLPLDVERTGLHVLTLPLDVERTETVRSGPSGSAIHMELHAQARVAVPLTLPLDVERTKTVRSGPSGRATEAPVGGDCRPGGLPTTRVPRAQGVRREARGEPGGATARGARGTCARQEPHRVWPGPARRPRRCERCAEIDEYVAQK